MVEDMDPRKEPLGWKGDRRQNGKLHLLLNLLKDHGSYQSDTSR